MTTATEDLYMARIELGSASPRVTRVSAESLRVPDYNKPRARVVPRETRAWWFTATRTALGEQLCPPGAAAIGRTETEAIAAAMRVMSQYQAARGQR